MSVELTTPDSAKQGTYVNVSVLVTNTLGYHASFRTEVFAGIALIFSTDETILNGQSKTYNTGFTMPEGDITVLAWVERWAFDHWAYYGADSKVVGLEMPATYHLDVYVPPWATGGYIDPGSGDYPAHSVVTLTAHPLSGYQFVAWGGDASGTDPTYNLYMDSNKYVEAYFELVPVVVPEPEFAGFSITKYV